MKRFLLKKRGCILALALSAWLIIPIARATTADTPPDLDERVQALEAYIRNAEPTAPLAGLPEVSTAFEAGLKKRRLNLAARAQLAVRRGGCGVAIAQPRSCGAHQPQAVAQEVARDLAVQNINDGNCTEASGGAAISHGFQSSRYQGVVRLGRGRRRL